MKHLSHLKAILLALLVTFFWSTSFILIKWGLAEIPPLTMESSIVNGTMLIQIAILAWIFLGEGITLQEIIGMAVATVGAVLVQLRYRIVQKINCSLE